MQRLAQVVLLALASLISLVVLAPALAFTDPHVGGYTADPDACAQCHRTHTAISSFITIPFFDMDRCFSCHDGTGSIYNTTQDFKASDPNAYRHRIAGMDALATLQCANCHETHKVTDASSRLLVNPLNTREPWTLVDTIGATGYDDSGTTSGIYQWCERCHQAPLGDIGYTLLNNVMGSVYIPYPVEITWRTSRDPLASPLPGVDESGTTTGYWGYFTAAAYNSTSTTTGEAHGRASMESTTTTFYGPYFQGYPALPCTICHAKHGSNQPWMIVDSITVDATTTTGYDMKTEAGQLKFCTSCHDRGTDTNTGKCTDCHHHGKHF